MTDEGEKGKQARRQRTVGVVTSVSGDKTVRVVVNTVVRHPIYGKYIRRRTKLAVHDPSNQAHVGDRVEIVSCRRLSKSKAWRLGRIVRAAGGGEDAAGGGQ